METHSPPSPVAAPRKVLLDARGRRYEPAIGPRLKILLFFIFGCVAVLGASGVYLLAIDVMNQAGRQNYTNQFSLWILFVHILVGLVLVAPFLAFGLTHLKTARHRPNKAAVKLGISLFITSLVVGVSGLALVQLDKMPQVPKDTIARWVIYYLHAVAPLVAVGFYVLHRRAGPDIQWRWGYAWGGVVGVFVLAMVYLHSQDPRKWNQTGSPEGLRYFEPSLSRTTDGKFIPQTALMMDQYCLNCHQDIYNNHFHSAHKFSSFNNPAYLFSVRETRKVSLERDKEMRASRWCAGCHDPVPFFSGQFDDPKYDDVNHPTAQAGITCTVCHAIVNVNSRVGNGDYTIEEPLHYPFAYSDNPVLQWINHQLVKAKPDFHKQTFLKDFHKSEAFCSTCHKVSLPMALNHYKEFLRGQNHNDTYWLSGVSGHGARSFYYPPVAKTNCAECHMPLQASDDFGHKDFDGSGVRKVHDHRFPGANTGLFPLLSQDQAKQENAEGLAKALQSEVDFLRGKDPEGKDRVIRIDIFGVKPGGTIDDPLIAPLRPKLPALKPGTTYLVEVVLRTLTVGHPFTQGTADSNEVWVEFTAKSGGRVIGRSGGMDEGPDKGRVDEWSHFVNILMLDRDGKRIDRRNPQDIFTPLYNHQIPPGAGQVVHYKLDVPADVKGPVELEARLRYRKFDYTYMEKVYPGKVPILPVIDLCSDRVVLPVEGVAASVAEQTSPIKPTWQRWNDYGIGCFLEGGVDSKKGEFKQAEEAFLELLKTGEKDAQGHAYLNLARVYNSEGRLTEAVEMLNKARTADPPAPWWTVAWFTGLVNAQNNHLDEAVASYEKILDPNNQPKERKFDFSKDYVVINELGKSLFLKSQGEDNNPAERRRLLKKAVDTLEQTLAIDPEDLDAHYWLSQCYTRLGEEVANSENDRYTGPSDAAALERLMVDFDNGKRSVYDRVRSAVQLCEAVTKYGEAPGQPQKPKLPLLQKLRGEALKHFREAPESRLAAAAALVLGHVHRQAHAIFKPDESAQGRAIGLYKKDHPAAAHAAEAIVIYPLDRWNKVLSARKIEVSGESSARK